MHLTQNLCARLQAEWLTVTFAYVTYSSYIKTSMLPILQLRMSRTPWNRERASLITNVCLSALSIARAINS